MVTHSPFPHTLSVSLHRPFPLLGMPPLSSCSESMPGAILNTQINSCFCWNLRSCQQPPEALPSSTSCGLSHAAASLLPSLWSVCVHVCLCMWWLSDCCPLWFLGRESHLPQWTVRAWLSRAMSQPAPSSPPPQQTARHMAAAWPALNSWPWTLLWLEGSTVAV